MAPRKFKTKHRSDRKSKVTVKNRIVRSKPLLLFLFFLLLFLGKIFDKNDTKSLPEDNSQQLIQAYTNQTSNIQVRGDGTVIKLLSDDLKGTRHQKFIVKVSENLTILIAHNIDLAPRLDTLKRGEHISFYGEYEWNRKGGLVHWTHHDPGKRHPDGWIKYNDKIYQ